MLVRLLPSLASLILASSVLLASAATPTVWSIHNNSQRAIEITCTGKDPHADLVMTSPAISVKAQADSSLTWGDAWFNDGLGLNAGSFNCTVKDGARTVAATGEFKSDWGESVALTFAARDDGWVVTKAMQKSGIARSK